jgi:hypothetical protein
MVGTQASHRHGTTWPNICPDGTFNVMPITYAGRFWLQFHDVISNGLP